MADNIALPATGSAAADEVTYSGDASQKVQLVRFVQVTGAEGSKTVVDLPGEATNGLDVDVTRVPAPLSTTGGGTEATALRVTVASDSTGVLSVNDNGSSLTVDGTVTAANAAGDVAHDMADSGNPVKIGGVAVSGSATPTSVAAADRVRFIANQHGIPYSINGHPNLITREYDFGTAAQTDANLAAAAVAADERVYVTRLEATCDAANTVNVSVRAGFGAASVPAASSSGVSGMIGSHPGVPPGSGFMCGNGGGLIAVGGAGEEPRLTSSAATTGNLHVVISYFLIDETP